MRLHSAQAAYWNTLCWIRSRGIYVRECSSNLAIIIVNSASRCLNSSEDTSELAHRSVSKSRTISVHSWHEIRIGLHHMASSLLVCNSNTSGRSRQTRSSTQSEMSKEGVRISWREGIDEAITEGPSRGISWGLKRNMRTS